MRIETAGKIGLGAFLVVWIGGIVVSLGGSAALIYIVYHFIKKYW